MKRFFAVLACLILASALAFAGGGAGGALFGLVEPGWDPSFGLVDLVDMPWNLGYLGGYGYEVDNEGLILGYFGLAFMDSRILSGEDGGSGAIGGVGGAVLGTRIIAGDYIHLDAALRLGLGAAYVGNSTAGSAWASPAYMVAYIEPYLELGVGIFPWMHLSATLGYQVMGNCFPGPTFGSFFTRAPTIGLTVTFGSYYY